MWKRLGTASVIAGALLAGAARAGIAEPLARPEDASWRSFVSQAGRFRLELPADPVVTPDRERLTLLGAVTGEVYTVRLRDLVLTIEVRDLPALARHLVPAQLVLESTRESVAADLDAVEVQHREVGLQGLPARDFVYRVPGQPPVLERALAVLVGGRLYLLTGRPVDAHRPVPEIERFFASFRFWGEAQEVSSGAERPRAGARTFPREADVRSRRRTAGDPSPPDE